MRRTAILPLLLLSILLIAGCTSPSTEDNVPEQHINFSVAPMEINYSRPLPVILFTNPTCTSCPSPPEPVIKTLQEQYAAQDIIRLYRYNASLTNSSSSAYLSVQGALCALRQGALWQWYHELYDTRPAITPTSLTEAARNVSMSTANFTRCIQSSDPKTYARNMIRLNGTVSGYTFQTGIATVPPKDQHESREEYLRLFDKSIRRQLRCTATDFSLSHASWSPDNATITARINNTGQNAVNARAFVARDGLLEDKGDVTIPRARYPQTITIEHISEAPARLIVRSTECLRLVRGHVWDDT